LFAEHQGLGDWLSSPISKAGGRIELDKPLFGPVSSYIAGELAADHTSGSWKPTVGAFAGLRVDF